MNLMKINSRNSYFLFIVLLAITLVVLSFYAGYEIRDRSKSNNSSEEQFPLVVEAFEILKKNGLKEMPDTTEIQYYMIRGMLDAYNDPYTVFIEPDDHELQSDQLSGKFGGIGCSIKVESDNTFILYPYPDSPAENAGVQARDQLVAVDSMNINEKTTIEDIQVAIRGPIGQNVQLTIARQPDYSRHTVLITREEVSIPSVTWNSISSESYIGIIQIHIIAATTVDEVKDAIYEMQDSGIVYVILDLRDNSGGLVDAAVETAKLFLKDGIVIHQQYRDQPVSSFIVDKNGEFSSLPLVIFVNQNTASSSEIIAGALQAQHRSLLIGAPTYGKDSIQLVFDLQDHSSLHVTAAHWWLEENKSIAGKGLIPDIELPPEHQDEENYIQTATKVFSEYLDKNQVNANPNAKLDY